MKYSILLVDDEIAILQMLVEFLGDKYNIKNAINGKTALNFIKQEKFDLVITDWMLPDISGVEIVYWIRNNAKYKDIPIIMLTAKSSQSDKVIAFNKGADDYITKPIALLEFEARIKALIRRSVAVDDVIIKYKNLTLNTEQQTFYIDNNVLDITGKEFKLLKLMIKNPKVVYSREQIIDYIYQAKDISDRAVDVLVSRVRKRLIHNNCDLLKSLRGLGYRLSKYE